MKFICKVRLEKVLVLLLAASLAVPPLLGLFLLVPANATRATAMLRNRTLGGMQPRVELLPFTRATLFSAQYQTALARFYNVRFAGREVAIRFLNEAYLHFFHMSLTNNVVGKHFSIFESWYPIEYCLQRGNDDALRVLVGELRRMQDFCQARHTAFAVVITPSKAAVYPEDLPEDWLRRHRPEPRYYDLFVPLLQKAGIQYVDGHRIAMDMKPAAKVKLFPEGGTHWGQPLALATVNALLELLSQQGLAVQTITNYRTHFTTDPEGQDADMSELLNTLFPRHYPVLDLDVQPSQPQAPNRPNLVVVGGSFMQVALTLLSNSAQFSEVEHYFYYKMSKNSYLDGERRLVANPTGALNFDADIFATDALVLEVNEQTLYAPAAHLTSFLHDALAVLPGSDADKAPFHYESHISYCWGDTLFFSRDYPKIDLAATTGFDDQSKTGSNSYGAVSTVQLLVPPAHGDMVLEVTAGAYHITKSEPEQTVYVSVNGRAAGAWRLNSLSNSLKQLTIPRDWLQEGMLRIEFRPKYLISPAEVGISRSTQKMGFRIFSLRLREN